ncbi:hypothetical protein [Agrobacterium tumefaciens]|uniref:hypothetical protein n=1 Tax=Agrobacterium tumefaciens TaxID=358 RepID=UPI0012DAA974|nr:hypothetical protein [Agrobacterium tumefaciens]
MSIITREPYDGGDEPPGGDKLEARVTKLESQFEKLNDKVDQLRIDSAVMKEKISNLPSKGFIVTATISALAFFSALMVFREKIVALIG